MMRALLVMVAVGLMAAPAAASPDRDTADLMSRQLFAAGEARFQAGDYRGAIEAFLAADRIQPAAIFAFDIAVCHERLGDSAGAVRYYRAYLDRDPDALTLRAAQARIDALSSALAGSARRRNARCESTHPDLRDPLPAPRAAGTAEVTIVSLPVGAEVFCHGRRLGETPIRVAVARRRNTSLLVSRHGYLDAVVRLDGERPVAQPVLQRLARLTVNPDLKDPMEDLR